MVVDSRDRTRFEETCSFPTECANRSRTRWQYMMNKCGNSRVTGYSDTNHVNDTRIICRVKSSKDTCTGISNETLIVRVRIERFLVLMEEILIKRKLKFNGYLKSGCTSLILHNQILLVLLVISTNTRMKT